MQAKTKRVKHVMAYTKENTNINEHRRVIVKLNNKNIFKSAYRDKCTRKELRFRNKPWINKRIQKMIKIRDRIFKKLKNDKSLTNKTLHKKFRNRVATCSVNKVLGQRD